MDQQTIYGKSHLAKIFLCYTLRGDQHESILLFYCHIDNFYLDWIYSAFFGTNLTFLLGFRCIKKFFFKDANIMMIMKIIHIMKTFTINRTTPIQIHQNTMQLMSNTLNMKIMEMHNDLSKRNRLP